MSKKIQLTIKSVWSGTKESKGGESTPMASFSMSGDGWSLKWKGKEEEAPFEVSKTDINNSVLIDVDFKAQKTL